MRPRHFNTILLVFSFGCQADVVPLLTQSDASTRVDASRPTDYGGAPPDTSSQQGPLDLSVDRPVDASAPSDLDAIINTVDSATDAADARDVDTSATVDMAEPSGRDGAPADGGAAGNDGAREDGGDLSMADMAGPPPCVEPVPNLNLQPPVIAPDECMTCTGAPMPAWRLIDFQDDSCGSGLTYGLDSFAGRATLVALFNAGCGYCQRQAQTLDRMANELAEQGHSVYFAAVNGERYEAYQDRILDRCTLPFFQDTLDDDAIGAMGGAIYDMYVYRPDGTLHVYLSGSGEVDTYLSEPGGYANVREAILSAVRGEEYVPPDPPIMIDNPDGGIPGDDDEGD